MSLTTEGSQEVIGGNNLQEMYGLIPSVPSTVSPINPLEGEERNKTFSKCRDLLNPKNFTLIQMGELFGLAIQLKGGNLEKSTLKIRRDGNRVEEVAREIRKSILITSSIGIFYWQVIEDQGKTRTEEVKLGLDNREVEEEFLYQLNSPPRVFISRVSPKVTHVLSRLLQKDLSRPPEASYVPRYEPNTEEIRWMLVRQYNHTFPDSQPIYLRTPVPK